MKRLFHIWIDHAACIFEIFSILHNQRKQNQQKNPKHVFFFKLNLYVCKLLYIPQYTILCFKSLYEYVTYKYNIL